MACLSKIFPNGTMFLSHLVDLYLGVEIFLKKVWATGKGEVNFEIGDRETLQTSI